MGGWHFQARLVDGSEQSTGDPRADVSVDLQCDKCDKPITAVDPGHVWMGGEPRDVLFVHTGCARLVPLAYVTVASVREFTEQMTRAMLDVVGATSDEPAALAAREPAEAASGAEPEVMWARETKRWRRARGRAQEAPAAP